LQCPLFEVDISEIIAQEADEPNAVVDFLRPSFWPAMTVEMLIFLRWKGRPLSERMASGNPRSANTRAKASKTPRSRVVSKASQHRR